MLLVKTTPKREETAVETSSQDNQLFPTLEGQDTKVSTLNHRRPSRDGSPEAKRARMGSVKQLGSCSQSVAERIKESTLKLQELSTQNGNGHAVAEIKTPFPVFAGRKDLNEVQLNTVRVIAQHLKELGLREAVNALVEETGCKIEHTHAAHLRKAIKTGNWNEALTVLERSQQFLTDAQYESARCEFIIQKILDLFSQNEVVKVVHILRNELPRYPGNVEMEQLYRLIYATEEELPNMQVMIHHSQPDYKQKVAKTIEKIMPSSFMLQEGRLDQVLNKAMMQQVAECAYHLSDRSKQNLPAENILVDHTCAIRPDACFHSPQTITERGIVFSSEFSPNGKFLATATMNNNIRLYRVSKKSWQLTLEREMAHKTAKKVGIVSCISWSHDSKFVAIACGSRVPFEISVFEAKTGKTHRIIKKVNSANFTSCAFLWNSYDLAIADEFGHFQIHDVTEPYEKESNPIVNFEGLRIKKLTALRTGGVAGLDSHNRIRRYTYKPFKTEQTLVKEFMPCSNFCVHKSEKYILTTTEVNLHLWDVKTRALVRTFASCYSKGSIIECSFGGPNDEYIAAGSPYGKIMVYNINDTFPILDMKGHVNTVCSLTWHPKAKGMLVSSAGDSLVRVWHVGCGLECCDMAALLEEDRKNVAFKKYQKTQKALEKQVKQERKQLKRNRKAMEKLHRLNNKKEEIIDVTTIVPNGVAQETDEVPPPEKHNKKRKHKKKEKKDRNEDSCLLITPDGEILDTNHKSRRKSKRRNRMGALSLSMDVEVDDSSNGKTAVSGDLSENNSVRSQL